MKNYIKSTFIIGALTLVSNMTLAYLYTGSSEIGQGNKPDNGTLNNAKSAGCAPAVRKYILEFNDVSALLEMGGFYLKTVRRVLLLTRFLKEVV